jgi:tetratricopeptide (TPR) repeat protein
MHAGANLAAGHPDAAVTYLQTALRSRPDYFDAHYNLGPALAMQNNFAAAVRLNPQNANAKANLGAALAELGNGKEAIAFGKNPGHRSQGCECA